MACAATVRLCWHRASAVHIGKVDLGVRRIVRIEGPRNEEELGAARGSDRSIILMCWKCGGIGVRSGDGVQLGVAAPLAFRSSIDRGPHGEYGDFFKVRPAVVYKIGLGIF